MSDMESDNDDVFTDDSKGAPGTGDDQCHSLNRKRRRGIIEKRRRDRINNSLTELRRLVPAAFEKQGSAKLEKAEILQMTVDHLRLLHTKGMDIFSFDPQRFVMDYHGIGFRECASEVARYLMGFEGMDLQDPIRLRLMSHLQCFSAQRDLALKSTTSSSPWSPVFLPVPQYSTISSRNGFSSSSGSNQSLRSTSSLMSVDSGSSSSPTSRKQRDAVSSPVTPTSSGSSFLSNSSSVSFRPGSYEGDSRRSFNDGPAQPSPVRPYRPWGTEMAY